MILSVIANRPGPLLVANQSDRLGSRLCAIVNAWSLASLLSQNGYKRVFAEVSDFDDWYVLTES